MNAEKTPMMTPADMSIMSIHTFSCTAGQWYLWIFSTTRRSYTSEPLVTVDAIVVVVLV